MGKKLFLFFCQIYSEEKAKLLRDVMAKIDGKSETLEWVQTAFILNMKHIDSMCLNIIFL